MSKINGDVAPATSDTIVNEMASDTIINEVASDTIVNEMASDTIINEVASDTIVNEVEVARVYYDDPPTELATFDESISEPDVIDDAAVELIVSDDPVTLTCNANGHGADARKPNPNQCLCIPTLGGQLHKLGIDTKIGDVIDLNVWVWKHVRGRVDANGQLVLSGVGDRTLSLKHGERRTIVAKRYVKR
jgi:hypothetical protein